LEEIFNKLLSEIELLFDNNKVYNLYKSVDSKLAKQPISVAPPLQANDFCFNLTKISNKELLNTGTKRPAIYTLYYKIMFLKLLMNENKNDLLKDNESLFKSHIEDIYEKTYLKEFTYYIQNENKFLSFLNYETSFQPYYIDSVIKETINLFDQIKKYLERAKIKIINKNKDLKNKIKFDKREEIFKYLRKELTLDIDLKDIENYLIYLNYIFENEKMIANIIFKKNNEIKEINKNKKNKLLNQEEKEQIFILRQEIKELIESIDKKFNPYKYGPSDIKNFLLKSISKDSHVPNKVNNKITKMISLQIRKLLINEFINDWENKSEEDILKVINSGVKYSSIYKIISNAQQNIDSLLTNNLKVFKNGIPNEKRFSIIEKSIYRLDSLLKKNGKLREEDIYKEILKTKSLIEIGFQLEKIKNIEINRDSNYIFNSKMKESIKLLVEKIKETLEDFKENVLLEFYSSKEINNLNFNNPLLFINLFNEQNKVNNEIIKELILTKEFQLTLNRYWRKF